MSDSTQLPQKLPDAISAIKERGYVTWSTAEGLSSDFKQNFDAERIPVVGIRHVRLWDVQVDDEREIDGHERTSVPGEELWDIILKAKDGSNYEVNAKFVIPIPE